MAATGGRTPARCVDPDTVRGRRRYPSAMPPKRRAHSHRVLRACGRGGYAESRRPYVVPVRELSADRAMQKSARNRHADPSVSSGTPTQNLGTHQDLTYGVLSRADGQLDTPGWRPRSSDGFRALARTRHRTRERHRDAARWLGITTSSQRPKLDKIPDRGAAPSLVRAFRLVSALRLAMDYYTTAPSYATAGPRPTTSYAIRLRLIATRFGRPSNAWSAPGRPGDSGPPKLVPKPARLRRHGRGLPW